MQVTSIAFRYMEAGVYFLYTVEWLWAAGVGCGVRRWRRVWNVETLLWWVAGVWLATERNSWVE